MSAGAHDFRLSVGVIDHPKIVKLRRRLGADAVLALIRLWGFTARNRPRGDLMGMDADDIEIAAGWDGEPGSFVAQLLDLVLLDDNDGVLAIHDWPEWNAWAYHAPERQERARKAANQRWHTEDDPEGMRAACDSDAESMPGAMPDDAQSNAPSPSPSPTPTPSPSPNRSCARDETKPDPDKPSLKTKRKRTLQGWKLDAFIEFWDAFAYKDGKREAADAWLDIDDLTQELVDNEILPAAQKEAERRPGLIAQKKTPKMAQGWLSARRWEDEGLDLGAVKVNEQTGEVQQWYETWAGIEEKGRELGIERGENEPPPVFKQRVFKKAGLSNAA